MYKGSLAETPLPSNITCMICCPETEVTSYNYTLRNVPEERKYQRRKYTHTQAKTVLRCIMNEYRNDIKVPNKISTR